MQLDGIRPIIRITPRAGVLRAERSPRQGLAGASGEDS